MAMSLGVGFGAGGSGWDAFFERGLVGLSSFLLPLDVAIWDVSFNLLPGYEVSDA
jgi:hypothetical protein